MADDPLQQQTDAARAYQREFVPALFAQWAPQVVIAGGIAPGDRVLDVACGTGVLARAARELGGAAHVTGVDANPGMIAVAGELEPAIAWHEGVAERLPFDDGVFDVVVSQFGLMFFGDRERAMREMRRVAVDGGHVLAVVWDRLAANGAFGELVDVLDRIAGRRAGDALRAPFALGSTEDLLTSYRTAGFADATVATRRGTATFASLERMVDGEVRGWLPVMGVHLSDATIAEVHAAAAPVLARHVAPDGRLVFPLSAHFVSGTA